MSNFPSIPWKKKKNIMRKSMDEIEFPLVRPSKSIESFSSLCQVKSVKNCCWYEKIMEKSGNFCCCFEFFLLVSISCLMKATRRNLSICVMRGQHESINLLKVVSKLQLFILILFFYFPYCHPFFPSSREQIKMFSIFFASLRQSSTGRCDDATKFPRKGAHNFWVWI